MEAVCKGVTIGRGVTSHRQVDEAFCDNETIVGQDINDVIRFKEEMRKFESQSSAIMSRTSKSKIMYIGKWAGREDSPFPSEFLVTPKFGVLLRIRSN